MGLSKSVILPTGTTVTYWRIMAIHVDLEANFSNARVGGYVVKADALLKKKAHKYINYSFRGSANPIVMNSDPTTWKASLEDKIRDADADEDETPIEQAQRISLLGFPGTLVGATIVSDLPD